MKQESFSFKQGQLYVGHGNFLSQKVAKLWVWDLEAKQLINVCVKCCPTTYDLSNFKQKSFQIFHTTFSFYKVKNHNASLMVSLKSLVWGASVDPVIHTVIHRTTIYLYLVFGV